MRGRSRLEIRQERNAETYADTLERQEDCRKQSGVWALADDGEYEAA